MMISNSTSPLWHAFSLFEELACPGHTLCPRCSKRTAKNLVAVPA